jgi:hypothetical protein
VPHAEPSAAEFGQAAPTAAELSTHLGERAPAIALKHRALSRRRMHESGMQLFALD